LLLHGGDLPVHVHRRGDIGFNSQSISADELHGLGDLAAAILVDVGDNEIRAGPGERFGNRGADTSASPSDDG
jgi:hypothetical protein